MTNRPAHALVAVIVIGAAFAWLHSVQRVIKGEPPVLRDGQRAFDPLTTHPDRTRPPESPAAAELRLTSERAARSTILY